MGRDWLGIRTKTEASAFDAVRARILFYPEQVARDLYLPSLNIIAEDGKQFGREIIRRSYTQTGIRRASSGTGEAGRVKTGEMLRQFKRTTRRRRNGETISVGFIDGRPGYAIFQELGTSRITPMNATQQTREYMLSRIRGLAQTRRLESPEFSGFSEGDDE